MPRTKARPKTPAPLLTDHPYFRELKNDPRLFDERGLQKYGGDTCPLPIVFWSKITANIDRLNSRDDGSTFITFSAAITDMIKRTINRMEPKKKLQMPTVLSVYEYDAMLDGITVADMDHPVKYASFSQPFWFKDRVFAAQLPAPNTYLRNGPQRLRELIKMEIQWYTIDRFIN